MTIEERDDLQEEIEPGMDSEDEQAEPADVAADEEDAEAEAEPGETVRRIEKGYYQGTGRRKTSVARVRLFPGTGEFIVNDKTPEDYFTERDILQRDIRMPLELTDTLGNFNVLVRVRGGGIVSQATAVRHGVARALLDFDEAAFRPVLKKAGMLTRDARVKERKKVGLKRARKRPQYTKR